MSALDELKFRYADLTAEEIEAQVTKEWGDVRAVQKAFSLGKTTTYALWRRGKIKGAVVYGNGDERGKRLFNFASIRKYIAVCEEESRRNTLPEGMRGRDWCRHEAEQALESAAEKVFGPLESPPSETAKASR
jgi:hypothetical protein